MNKTPFFLFIFALCLVACSGKKSTETQFHITKAGIASLTGLDGGVYLKAIPKDNPERVLYFDFLTQNYQAQFSSGIYSLYFVAYQGPTSWQGMRYCASIDSLAIQGKEMKIDIVLRSLECLQEPFLTMHNDKNPQALWDIAIWDQAHWE